MSILLFFKSSTVAKGFSSMPQINNQLIHDELRFLFGDQSDACGRILRADATGWDSEMEKRLAEFTDSIKPENASINSIGSEKKHRLYGLRRVENSFCDLAQNIDPTENLNQAVKEFDQAWGVGKELPALRIAFDAKYHQGEPETAILKWLNQIEVTTRGHQVVLDLILSRIFTGAKCGAPENPARMKLYETFRQRVDSITGYLEWATVDENALKHPMMDYCRNLERSVCTPILLSGPRTGRVMWLTVDLFEDGLGSLAPDLFSLGWSMVHRESPSKDARDSYNSTASGEQDLVTFLESFDSIWKLTRLGDLGFSGRWRVTNRPTTQCAALMLEESHAPYCYPASYVGRSAECSMLVSLLAASGFVYDPIPATKPPKLPARVMLNTFYAATATVEEADLGRDLRTVLLGRVVDVDRKLGASSGYKLQKTNEEPPLIDTIVISNEDYVECKKNPQSQVSRAIERENQQKQKTSKIVRGVHFQPCTNIQQTLDWMLSVNQWILARKEAQRAKWDSKWAVDQNQSGEEQSQE